MPKCPTFPSLYNDMLQINISSLKKKGYLTKNRAVSGSISWTCNGIQTATAAITVHWTDLESFVELKYSYKKEPRTYKVQIVFENSNLNNGKVPFLLCPHTYQMARKLYLIDGWFVHRSASNSAMYECQTQSKKYRQIEKTYGAYFDLEKLYDQLYKKHFKKFYAGKPTKKFVSLQKQLDKANSFSLQEIEALYYV